MQKSIIEKLDKIKQEYEILETTLMDSNILSNIEEYKKLTKKKAKIQPIFLLYKQYLSNIKNEIDFINLIKVEKNDDLLEMLKEELSDTKNNINSLEVKLLEELTETNPNDSKNCIIEIKGAAGGEEANLFAGDLFRMYSRYSSKMEWDVEIIDYEEAGKGGYSYILFEIEGLNAFKYFKFESGVHRVQRIPQTETQGRVHTSTATVLVTPVSDEANEEIVIPSSDIRIDTYRASGSGGQHINKTDSAIRITHLKTGITVASQQGRSQHDNREKAMRMLKAKLIEKSLEEKNLKNNENKKTLVGTGDRSEKIRTYNYQQNRITDHRISFTLKKLDRVLLGNLEELVEVLLASESEISST